MDPAEKQGILDGLTTFLVGLGGSAFASVLLATPAVAEGTALTAGIAGVVAGINSYRRAAGLPAPAPAKPPA